MIFKRQYLRPAMCCEKFLVEKKMSTQDELGRERVSFNAAGILFLAIDTIAPREVEKWRGLKHDVDTVLIQFKGSAKAQIGDRLIRGDEIYMIEHVEQTFGYHLYYCQRRFDL